MSKSSQDRKIGIQIDLARKSDFDPIRNILADNDLTFEDLNKGHLKHFLVARERGQIVGVIGLELYEHTALLRSLAVRSRYRGKGLGYELAKRIELYAASLGIRHIYLLTITAGGFFEKHGYTKLPRDSAPEEIQSTSSIRGGSGASTHGWRRVSAWSPRNC